MIYFYPFTICTEALFIKYYFSGSFFYMIYTFIQEVFQPLFIRFRISSCLLKFLFHKRPYIFIFYQTCFEIISFIVKMKFFYKIELRIIAFDNLEQPTLISFFI